MHECKIFTTEIKSKCVKLVAKKYRVHWQRNKAKTCKEINGASVQTCWIFPEQIFSLVWVTPIAVFFISVLIPLLFVLFMKSASERTCTSWFLAACPCLGTSTALGTNFHVLSFCLCSTILCWAWVLCWMWEWNRNLMWCNGIWRWIYHSYLNLSDMVSIS